MPRYDYTCEDGHTFELVAGFDEETVMCPKREAIRDQDPFLEDVVAPLCGKPAKRHAVYRSQGVIFKGDGFTKSVRVPEPPEPPETGGMPIHGHLEELDNFAKKAHEYDENVRPERKKERKKDG